MFQSSITKLLLLLLYLPSSSCAIDNGSDSAPIVTLDYGAFRGRHDAAYNITLFRRLPFGASTAGANRFRAPQPPEPVPNGSVYDADRPFDMCPQRTVNGSEDCLYLGLYARPWTDPRVKRPVLVVFYGGGFIQGSASFDVPPPMYPVLNASAENDFITVLPNYRTGAFGLLPGAALKDAPDADLNAGLLDQRAALQWVRKHIAAFGGDPDNVTIQGQSAGGGSVVAQALAQQQQDKKEERLFQRAWASSPFWPKTYRHDEPEAEALFAQLAERVGCADATTAAGTLACLKSADLQALREASLAIAGSHTFNTSSYTWAPIIDGDFLRAPLSATSRFESLDAAVVSYNSHEGENFVPGGLGSAAGSDGFNSSEAGFEAWLRGFLPRLSGPQRDEVRKLYPAAGEVEHLGWNASEARTRAGVVYRDVVLVCPGLRLARGTQAAETRKKAGQGDVQEMKNKNGKGYVIEYTSPPAKHGSDTVWWNKPSGMVYANASAMRTYEGYAGAMGRFFMAGDPNAGRDGGVPAMPEVGAAEEWVIGDEGRFETAGMGRLEERCAFWRGVGGGVPF
ncbi:uncharacterized protein K452DRAFT_290790 [Aplosporella prunicola CBS 121167]|uniref:Carboxylic ester hydrolase n=1 Tax=Aplosporella prunicola CBS 121167 TaxID=1176127 RepID=A0A6A6B5Z8_9PEZI|nr:uncharacterized protein K452DRAFT_290790 [Aplosporella prunicola CBS 121167]KAF2138201.1 hypothetical protein K452DRAFT_290790 [Aplosporella prunicola CBS 121167]